ncbi:MULTISPECIES: hemolysin family protein [Brucella/Ochrobactrum group]|jgi:CBS domain containing-hemolysin-like protein|uniref:Hemolysin family protein n=1 Tax=Brucella pseudintermedia TaxID=370111 RepID=A0ABY5U8L9_9HYPH|nr:MULTISPECIES: hemolysin family protein [Brucella/Ochrobactrum group]KAB2682564.1 HlyC/CorC family transporter [Brucella pseudintermedia]MCO7725024.1 hemolysin family protein [Brucella intermedia]NKE76195.1 HlyC/CorC family transporter [Ochrobactrum sp. MC-1LL]TWH00229.1 Hemolysins and related proteins containing CBS domains [Ochrobactrum sp. J50]UWL59688.1 hemolysin family protein [Brucella pseudintermedia]
MADQTSHPPSAGENRSETQDAEGQSTQRPVVAEKRSLLSNIFPFMRSRQSSSLREDLADALSSTASEQDSAFSPEEKAMLHNILRLREIRVEDVMIPRADVEAVEISTPLWEVLELFEKSGHSRMPVYAETLDDPRGMIHIRDVLNYITKQARQKTARRSSTRSKATAEDKAAKFDMGRIDLTKTIGELNLMRKVLFVPPSMMASGLMARMQATHIQMALVIDEYGGTDGLVSLEDIVEMVVGDIEDEHDDEEIMIAEEADGVFVVDARADLEELAAKIGPSFEVGEHGEDVDTVGGLIFSVLGRIPVRGEVVQAIPGYEFHVLEVDPRRVKKVRIVPLSAADRRRQQRAVISTKPGEQPAQAETTTDASNEAG